MCIMCMRQKGTALLLAMIMSVIVMGVIFGLFAIVQAAGQSSADQNDYLAALETAEIGVSQVIARIRKTPIVDNEAGTDKIAFVGSDLEEDGISRIVTGEANGNTYTVRVRSAYFAWKTGNNEGGAFLREVTKSERESMSEPVFDFYEITSIAGETGEHDFQRGVQVVVTLEKNSVALSIPSALYIDNDPDPELCGMMHVDGRDHSLEDPAGTGSGGSSGGGKSGQLNSEDYLTGSGHDKPAIGYDGEYASLDFKGAHAEDDVISANEDGDTVTGEDAFIQTKVDLRTLAAAFVGGTADDIQATRPNVTSYDAASMGTHVDMGSSDDWKVTYIDGSPKTGAFAGKREGYGVLVVNGDLHISGQFTFYGLVIVLGDIKITGGSAHDRHNVGAVMVENECKVTGHADVWWSQEAIDKIIEEFDPPMQILIKPKVWRSLDKAEVDALSF